MPTTPAVATAHRPARTMGFGLSTAVRWEVLMTGMLLSLLAGVTLHWAYYLLALVFLLVALAFGVPFKGLTLTERLLRRRLFAHRAHSRIAHPAVPSELVPVAQWLPGFSIKQTLSARGNDVGIISHGSSWTALLGVASDDNIVSERSDSIDVAALNELTVQDDIIFASLQMLTYTVPAPAPMMVTPGSRAVESYRQILQGTAIPAVRRTWIGVRLDPRLCLEAITSRGASRDGIYATLRFGLHRVRSALKRQGIVTNELTATDIHHVMALTSGSSPDASDDRSHEEWDVWACDGFYHASCVIGSFGPDPSAAYQQVLDVIAHAPIIFGVSSYILDQFDQASGAIRVCAPTREQALSAIAHIESELAEVLTFRPSQGHQVPALFATVPLGREVAQ